MKFDEKDLAELLELNRIAAAEKFKSIQIKGNTAMIPDGQKVAEQQEAIARLMENVKNNWVSSRLRELGCKEGAPVSIDLKTGEITETKVETEIKK